MTLRPWLFLIFLLMKSWTVATLATWFMLWVHGKGFTKVFAFFCFSVGFMGLMEFVGNAFDRSLAVTLQQRSVPAVWCYWIGNGFMTLCSWSLLGYFIWRRKNGTRS